MKDETDYRAEAAHTERMRGLLEGDDGFRVPRVAWELCADRVIATELLRGIPLDRYAAAARRHPCTRRPKPQTGCP
jgi:predicted unusual protein kinase regulating ubiquinone biosynthesis (AarF/ABC1/UbiB family)